MMSKRTGAWLALLAVGGILAFAVTTNTSVFDFHIAGYVIMVIAILGLVIPRRGYTWLGRRRYVRRTRVPGGELEEASYPPYVVHNPGTANARAGISDRPSVPPDPRVAAWTEPTGARRGGSARPRRTPADSGRQRDSGRRADTGQQTGTAQQPAAGAEGDPTQQRETVPPNTEIVEDVYEE